MVRIHIERIIGSLKQKYTILQNILPIRFISDSDNSIAQLDKVISVCCALVNLCPAIVSQQ